MSAKSGEELKELYTKILARKGITKPIKNVQVQVPSMAGDHFASNCEIVTVNFEDPKLEALELFVKTAIHGNKYAEMIDEMEMFDREAQFFNEITPLFYQFCRDKLGSEDFLNGIIPVAYHADKTLIVMENLTKKGYIMLDKTIAYTFSRAKDVIELFAKFHAVSYALIQDMGEDNFIRKFPTLVISNCWGKQGEKMNKPWTEGTINSAVNTLKRFPVEGHEEALEYLTKFWSDGYPRICRHYEFTLESCAQVLNHGDAWSGNILFLPREGEENDDCTLIDLQTIHLGSPVMDLQLYLHISVDKEVRHKHWKTLLECYYQKFKECVEGFKGRVEFSFEDLVKNYRRKSEPGFVYSLFILFGWDTMDEIGDPQEMDGDFGDHFTASMDAAVARKTAGRGEFYSTEIVTMYKKFQEIIQNE